MSYAATVLLLLTNVRRYVETLAKIDSGNDRLKIQLSPVIVLTSDIFGAQSQCGRHYQYLAY